MVIVNVSRHCQINTVKCIIIAKAGQHSLLSQSFRFCMQVGGHFKLVERLGQLWSSSKSPESHPLIRALKEMGSKVYVLHITVLNLKSENFGGKSDNSCGW